MSFIPETTPFTALPNALRGQLTPPQLAVLWTLQSYRPNIWPSYQKVGNDCRMSRRQVINVVGQLEEMGLVEKVGRSDGKGQTSNVYRVKVWHLTKPEATADMGCHPIAEPLTAETPVTARGAESAPPQQPAAENPVTARGAQDALVQDLHHLVQDLHPPSAGSAPEEEQSKKNNQQEAFNPSPTPQEPKRKRAAKAPAVEDFQPSAADIPLELQQFAEQILDYWPVKSDSHSHAAWKGMIRGITKILHDPQGGPDMVSDQIDEATQKRWGSINYSKWVQFGRPKPVRLGNGSGGQYLTAREKQRDELHELAIEMAIRDPAHASPQYLALAQERIRTTQPSFIDVPCSHA